MRTHAKTAMPVTPDHQGSADEDQQVATWTRMLQAGTLTEAGYLAMVTAWARATFERQWQQEGLVLRGAASAAGGPAVVHATQLPVVSAASAPQLDQGPQEVPEDNRDPQELGSDGSSGEEEVDDEWLPGGSSGGGSSVSSPPSAPRGRRHAKQRRTPQPTCVPHRHHSCLECTLTMSVRWCAAVGVRSGAGRK